MGSLRSEQRREYERIYWADPVNKARRDARVKIWRAKNKEILRERNRANHIANRERNSARKRETRAKLRTELFDALGYYCAKCGFDDVRALQVDHVNGGGGQVRRLKASSKYYSGILSEIRAGSTEYQMLCANCNWIKRLENKEL